MLLIKTRVIFSYYALFTHKSRKYLASGQAGYNCGNVHTCVPHNRISFINIHVVNLVSCGRLKVHPSDRLINNSTVSFVCCIGFQNNSNSCRSMGSTSGPLELLKQCKHTLRRLCATHYLAGHDYGQRLVLVAEHCLFIYFFSCSCRI